MEGWWQVHAGDCEFVTPRGFNTVYWLAFRQRNTNGNLGMVEYKPATGFWFGNPSVESSNRKFCVVPEGIFDFTAAEKDFANCAADYSSVRFPMVIELMAGEPVTVRVKSNKLAQVIPFVSPVPQAPIQTPAPPKKTPPPEIPVQTPTPPEKESDPESFPEFVSLLKAKEKNGYLGSIKVPQKQSEVQLSFIEKLGIVVYQNVYVDSLETNSFLEKAGLQKGDRLFSFDEKPIKDLADLEGSFFAWSFVRMLGAGPPSIELGIIRNGKKISPISVQSFPKIKEFKENSKGGSIPGVDLKGDIIIMGHIFPPKTLDDLNFGTDIINGINGKNVKSIGQLNGNLKDSQASEEVNLRIWNSKKPIWKAVIRKILE